MPFARGLRRWILTGLAADVGTCTCMSRVLTVKTRPRLDVQSSRDDNDSLA